MFLVIATTRSSVLPRLLVRPLDIDGRVLSVIAWPIVAIDRRTRGLGRFASSPVPIPAAHSS